MHNSSTFETLHIPEIYNIIAIQETHFDFWLKFLFSPTVQLVAHLDHWSSSPVSKQRENPCFFTDGTGQMEILTGQLMSLGTGEF